MLDKRARMHRALDAVLDSRDENGFIQRTVHRGYSIVAQEGGDYRIYKAGSSRGCAGTVEAAKKLIDEREGAAAKDGRGYGERHNPPPGPSGHGWKANGPGDWGYTLRTPNGTITTHAEGSFRVWPTALGGWSKDFTSEKAAREYLDRGKFGAEMKAKGNQKMRANDPARFGGLTGDGLRLMKAIESDGGGSFAASGSAASDISSGIQKLRSAGLRYDDFENIALGDNSGVQREYGKLPGFAELLRGVNALKAI